MCNGYPTFDPTFPALVIPVVMTLVLVLLAITQFANVISEFILVDILYFNNSCTHFPELTKLYYIYQAHVPCPSRFPLSFIL